MRGYGIVLAVALGVTLLLTPLVRLLASRLGAVVAPSGDARPGAEAAEAAEDAEPAEPAEVAEPEAEADEPAGAESTESAEAPEEGKGEAKADSPKQGDLPPGAELDPIAIEPERELDAEERARREAEEEERLRRERELIGDVDEDAPVAAKPAKLEGDASYAATGKRLRSFPLKNEGLTMV